MITNNGAFSSFSVNDINKAKEFYSTVLGLVVKEIPEGLQLEIGGVPSVFIYPKPNHEPATFTVLNVRVANIAEAVDALTGQGLSFEHYDGMGQNEKGIVQQGERGMAWFKDPAGNILSLIQE